MRITERTQYATLEPVEKYLTADAIKALKAKAEACLGSMYDLEFATFWACAGGDFSHLGDLSNPTVLQVYWCKRFVDFLDEFTQALKNLTLKPTPEETQAAEGLLPVSFGEAMLVFMQQWFGLKSYKEAEKITIGELLIAKRAAYNRDAFQRAYSRIQTKKLKSKK